MGIAHVHPCFLLSGFHFGVTLFLTTTAICGLADGHAEDQGHFPRARFGRPAPSPRRICPRHASGRLGVSPGSEHHPLERRALLFAGVCFMGFARCFKFSGGGSIQLEREACMPPLSNTDSEPQRKPQTDYDMAPNKDVTNSRCFRLITLSLRIPTISPRVLKFSGYQPSSQGPLSFTDTNRHP